MPDWGCRKCGAINLEAQPECEGCGRARSRTVIQFPVTPTPAWQHEPPPCTSEENDRALNLVKALMAQEISAHQAHLVLHAIFQGRELPEGQSVCECGIEMGAWATR